MTTTETSTPKKRTITLTDRAPVTIREDQWPNVASGVYSDHDNQYEFQANRTWKCTVRVRQHEDGRAIVYGVYDYDTRFQGERGFAAKAGLLLDANADLARAIREVGEQLDFAARESGHEFSAHIGQAVRECVADLPAEEI